MTSNIYFELTKEFNAARRIAVLTSGQAGVFHRVAIMSKDGDWILEETEEAARISDLPLPEAHARAVDLAKMHLPVRVR